jgi:hypothetical protein
MTRYMKPIAFLRKAVFSGTSIRLSGMPSSASTSKEKA